MRGRRIPRTGVSTSVDTQRLAAAVRGEGVDTRIWCSLAIVTSVIVDSAQGCFAEVYLTPSGDTFTARIAGAYAGNGFGLWCPLDVDDEVVVVAPSGKPEEGLVVSHRLWSAADPPATEMVSDPTDLLLRTKKGVKARVISGDELYLQTDPSTGGDLRVDAGNSKDVVVNGGTDAVARVGDTTKNGTLSGTVMVAGSPVAVQFTYVEPDGSTVGPSASAALVGEITSGAANFKG